MANLDSILKSRDITLPTKVCLVKALVFPVVMYGCESWTVKKAECQRIDAFELWCQRRLLRVPWTARRSNSPILKEIIKGNQSFIFIGRSGAEVGAPILWPPDAKNWLFWKDPDAEKDWQQEEKGMTEDEMVGWHHLLYWHEFEQAPGVGDRQGSLACISPWGLQSMGSRPPCPSPNPGVYSNSCPLSRGHHPTISSSVIPSSFCFQSFPASGSFPMSRFFASGGQSIWSFSFSISPSNGLL